MNRNTDQQESHMERARNNLEIKGYVHPEDTVPASSNYSAYQSYSGQGSDPYVTGYSTGVYAHDSTAYTDQELGIEEKIAVVATYCPVCDCKALYTCGCELKDMMCENSHVWYFKKSGQLVVKDPHKDE